MRMRLKILGENDDGWKSYLQKGQESRQVLKGFEDELKILLCTWKRQENRVGKWLEIAWHRSKGKLRLCTHYGNYGNSLSHFLIKIS